LTPRHSAGARTKAKGVVSDQIEKGRIEQIERMLPNHQAIGGGDGVFQLGAQRPGAGAVAAPPGTQPMTQLPGAQPLQTPVQQSTQGPPPGPAPTSTGRCSPASWSRPTGTSRPGNPVPGRGPRAPQTIAGQTVNVALPPGASPDYVKRMQRVETGNEKDPWTAKAGNGPDGKPLSSAGGAFQFINSTWAASKPPGAPDSAKAATPQQQAEALAT
jgi:hypothetical protein